MSYIAANPSSVKNRVWGGGPIWTYPTRVMTYFVPTLPETTISYSRALVGLNHRKFSGVNLPNFHKRKNRGELLPYTSYMRLDEEYTCTGDQYIAWSRPSPAGSWEQKFYPEGKALTSDHFTHGSEKIMFAYLQDLEINPAVYVQSAASSLYGRGWDALTFFAEFHHVVRMFRNLYPKLDGLFSQIPKGDLRNFWNVPFSEWLEFRYGWRILLYDIQDIHQLIKTFDDKERKRTKERVGEQFVRTASSVIEKSGSAGIGRFTKDESWDLSVRGSIIADFLPPKVRINLLTSAWELTTLSFVVDWFFSVGKSLDAISFLLSTGNYTASYGYQFTYEATQYGGEYIPANSYYSGSFSRDAKHTLEIRTRTPTSVPIAPQQNVNLNAFKVVDLLALLLQRVGTIFR